MGRAIRPDIREPGDVAVAVRGRVVTLRGTVDDAGEREAAGRVPP
jgi:osmotically-inducible protein OsmY